MIHTFVRYAERSLRWAVGDRANRLTGVLSALPADMMAEAARLVSRWSLPLDESPIDLLPYLLRAFGLPQYEEPYFQTLARLRTYLDTHAVAGAQAMLVAEAELCGFTSPSIETGPDSSFWLVSPDIGTGTVVFGDGTLYGDPGAFYGYLPTALGDNDKARRNFLRALSFFRPARERFLGLKGP